VRKGLSMWRTVLFPGPTSCRLKAAWRFRREAGV
jgi:hypothetical protein